MTSEGIKDLADMEKHLGELWDQYSKKVLVEKVLKAGTYPPTEATNHMELAMIIYDATEIDLINNMTMSTKEWKDYYNYNIPPGYYQ